MTGLSGNPDIVVIGAGAAGLAAGRRILEAGRSVAVIEAADHIGGRCVTDRGTFGQPFDRGASWLHSATANPLTPLAERYGFTILEGDAPLRRVWIRDRELSEAEVRDSRDYVNAMWAAIRNAGLAGRDVAASEVLPPGTWRDYARYGVSTMTGHDAEQASTLEDSRFVRAEGEWLLVEGLGSLVERHAAGLPVALETPVTAVDSSGPGVAVTTARGTLNAAAAIVTVSTGVLAEGAIAFTPGLPAWKQAAIDALPMGLLYKVALQFEPRFPDASAGHWLSYFANPSEAAFFRLGYAGTGLAVAFLGGSFARGLEAAGPGAAVDFCLGGLAKIFGSDITRHLVKTVETRWLSDPLTLGAYSGAKPGQAEARADMARPVAGKLFFAGEACRADWFATVAGAHLSGLEAAEAALETLD